MESTAADTSILISSHCSRRNTTSCKLRESYPQLEHYYTLHCCNPQRKYWRPMVPPSNQSCLIIGLDHKTLAYVPPVYLPEMTDNRVAEYEFKAFLRKISRKAEPELAELRASRKVVRTVMLILFTLFIIGLVLMMSVLNPLERINRASYSLIIGFVLCIIAWVGALVFYSFCLELLIGRVQERLMEKIHYHMTEENSEWRKRGVCWTLGPRGWWIEMWLDCKVCPCREECLSLSKQSTAESQYGAIEEI